MHDAWYLPSVYNLKEKIFAYMAIRWNCKNARHKRKDAGHFDQELVTFNNSDNA